MKTIIHCLRAVLLCLTLVGPPLHAQLLDHLQKLAPPESRLSVGDPDGDGRADLVVAGSTNGLRHFRGLGGGALLVMANLTNGAATELSLTQPAFYLRAFRGPGHLRDELIVGRAKFDVTNNTQWDPSRARWCCTM